MNEEPPRISANETRKLAAIMFTDMVGFSCQMGADEARMLRLLDVHNQMIHQAVVEHHGTVIKTVGDAFLVDFPSVVHAVQCAQTIQTRFKAHNTERAATEQIHVSDLPETFYAALRYSRSVESVAIPVALFCA